MKTIDIEDKFLEELWNRTQEQLAEDLRRYTPSHLEQKQKPQEQLLPEPKLQPLWQKAISGLTWGAKKLISPFRRKEKLEPQPTTALPELTKKTFDTTATKITDMYKWMYPRGLQDLPRQYGAALTEVGMELGEAGTWLARFCPGQENLPPWAEQSPPRQALTLAQDVSLVALGALVGYSAFTAITGLGKYLAYGKADKIAEQFARANLAKIKAQDPTYIKSLDDAIAKAQAALRSVTKLKFESLYFPDTMRWLGKVGRVLLKPISGPAAQVKANLLSQVKDVLANVGAEASPQILQTFAKTIEHYIGSPTTGIITQEFANATIPILNKFIPIMVEQVKEIGIASVPFERLTPEDKIVEEEMAKPLAKAPVGEEAAEEEVLNISSKEVFSIARRLEANPDDPVLLANLARGIYKDLGKGITSRSAEDAEAELRSAKTFNKELYGDSVSGKEAIESAEKAKARFDASIEITPKAPAEVRKEYAAEFEMQLNAKSGYDSIVSEVRKRGGLKFTPSITDHGNYNEIPLSAKNRNGLAIDELAAELNMSEDDLWDALSTYSYQKVLRRVLTPEVKPPTLPIPTEPTKIKRSEIVTFLSNELGVPIRMGHFKERAKGIYKPKKGIIRLKSPIDISTAAHEVGHYLDDKVFKFDRTKFTKELTALDPQHKQSKEGLAEFVSLYVTNREQAERLAPKFFEYFEETLSGSPDIKGILDTANEDYQRWLSMPATAKVASQIGYQPEKSGKISVGKLYTMFVDELYPLKRYVDLVKEKGIEVSPQENTFLLATLHRGWHGKADNFLRYKTFDTEWVYNGEPLNAIFTEINRKASMTDFDSYLVAKQSIFRLKQGKKIGLDVETVKEAVKELETRYPDFKELSERLYEYEDRLLQYARDSELISQEAYKAFRKNLSYVPLHRVMDTMRQSGLLGKGFVDLPKIYKRFAGSEREIIPPTESIVKDTYLVMDAADRNQIGLSLVKLAETHPELAKHVEKIPGDIARIARLSEQEIARIVKQQGFDLSEEEVDILANIFRPSMFKPTGNIITVIQNGKPNYYEVDPDLYRSLRMADKESQSLLIELMSYPARMLRLGAVTLSPEFLARNPVRDSFTALVYSKAGFIPGLDTMRGVFSAVRKDELYWKWKLSGGEHAMLTSLDREYMQQDVKDLIGSRMEQVKNVIRHPIQSAQMLAELGEEATRIGEFRLVLDGGKRWWNLAEKVPESESEKSKMVRAGYASRDVTLDFARLGTKTRAVNKIIAFWNANVQDLDKIRRSFQEKPTRTLYKLLLGITTPSILLWFANKDDPRYQELPQWQKDLFWIIPTEKRMYRIPKPFTLGMLFGSVPERILDYIYNDDPETIKELGWNILRGISPGVVPTALLPPMEMASNYSFFLERPIISEGLKNLPPEMQHKTYTPETLKKIGEILNVSPLKVDHLIRGWTGGFGRLALETSDAIVGSVAGKDIEAPAKTWADIPIVRGFVAREPWGYSESISRFYDKYDRAERGYNAIRQMYREGRKDEADKYKSRYPEYVYLKQLRTVAQFLGESRKRKDEIIKGNLSPDEKLIEIIEIEKRMSLEAKRILQGIK